MSARKGRRSQNPIQSDDEEAPIPCSSSTSQSQRQSQQQSSASSSQKTRLGDETINPELESQYLYDDNTISEAKRSRNIRQRMYGQMYQNAQGFQDKIGRAGFDLRKVLTENTLKGQQLGMIRTEQPSELYNAVKHANLCTKILLYQSEKVGDTKTYSTDSYLTALKKMGNKVHNRLARVFTKSVAIGIIQYNLIGVFDHEPTITKAEAKKTPRSAVRRKRVFDENLEEATQYEEGLGSGNGSGSQGTTSDQAGAGTNQAERISSNLFRVLKHKSRQREKPFNFFEFDINKESIGRTIENIFYTGFLVRDGHASLSSGGSQGVSRHDGDLILKPDKPPKKQTDDSGRQHGLNRNQHIISFSPKLYRQLLAAAKGETEIPSDLVKATTGAPTPATAGPSARCDANLDVNDNVSKPKSAKKKSTSTSGPPASAASAPGRSTRSSGSTHKP